MIRPTWHLPRLKAARDVKWVWHPLDSRGLPGSSTLYIQRGSKPPIPPPHPHPHTSCHYFNIDADWRSSWGIFNSHGVTFWFAAFGNMLEQRLALKFPTDTIWMLWKITTFTNLRFIYAFSRWDLRKPRYNLHHVWSQESVSYENYAERVHVWYHLCYCLYQRVNVWHC